MIMDETDVNEADDASAGQCAVWCGDLLLPELEWDETEISQIVADLMASTWRAAQDENAIA